MKLTIGPLTVEIRRHAELNELVGQLTAQRRQLIALWKGERTLRQHVVWHRDICPLAHQTADQLDRAFRKVVGR